MGEMAKQKGLPKKAAKASLEPPIVILIARYGGQARTESAGP